LKHWFHNKPRLLINHDISIKSHLRSTEWRTRLNPIAQHAKTDPIGSVMVVGGGIAGMQSAIDLANSGYYVYLVEKTSAIGGLMSQLDKTFPTNDCAM
jgi:heterodisulfide reductase subunit A-like polyferredoxin